MFHVIEKIVNVWISAFLLSLITIAITLGIAFFLAVKKRETNRWTV